MMAKEGLYIILLFFTFLISHKTTYWLAVETFGLRWTTSEHWDNYSHYYILSMWGIYLSTLLYDIFFITEIQWWITFIIFLTILSISKKTGRLKAIQKYRQDLKEFIDDPEGLEEEALEVVKNSYKKNYRELVNELREKAILRRKMR